MRLGILSDTHGHQQFTQQAARAFELSGAQRVIHCGDVGGPEIPQILAAFPVDYVWGNTDRNLPELRAAMAAHGHDCHEYFADLLIEGVRIAVLHGDNVSQLQRCIHSGTWNLVCYGHTHQAHWEKIGNTYVLNPGPVFRGRPRSVAVLDIPAFECCIVRLDQFA